jgi:hypothetical protein
VAHWTKRPQNHCLRCGYCWFPRGHNISAQCPRCGSAEVELALAGCLRAIGYLFLLPFLLLAAPFILAFLLLRLLFRATWFGAKLAGSGAAAGASAAVEHSRPARAWILEAGAVIARRAWAGLLFGLRWAASVKDDLAGDEDRDVNPVSLIAKLLTIVAVLGVAIVVLVKLFRWLS